MIYEQYVRIAGLSPGDLEVWMPQGKLRSAILFSEATKLRTLSRAKLMDAVTKQYNSDVGPVPVRATGSAAHHAAAASEISVDAIATAAAALPPPPLPVIEERPASVASQLTLPAVADAAPATPAGDGGNPFLAQIPTTPSSRSRAPPPPPSRTPLPSNSNPQ